MSSTEIDRTIVESGDGHAYLISLRDDDTLTVSDVTGLEDLAGAAPVGTWAFSTLRDVSALVLDIGRGLYLDETATANVLQFARIN